MKQKHLLSILLTMLMSVPLTLHAQTTQPPTDADDTAVGADPVRDEVEQVADADDTTGADATDAEEEVDGNARFIPTEQVSQDLGVSFPVDI
ncbi:MAG: hypothetical protein A3H44_13565 [Gammaproteobacteria bacterium RIFCSPLOWO2_02_FULL_57_10]|nr:MAG: hypothetical protein A3H44_13565 [Gammaproteobacteria bacterium RIFCSPLOWO2_02_FULL_57_10]